MQVIYSRLHENIQDRFTEAGIEVVEDLGPAGVILAVKEIPTELLESGKAYVYFAHVIKGQAYNMPMLRRLLDTGSTLIDYERIADERSDKRRAKQALARKRNRKKLRRETE